MKKIKRFDYNKVAIEHILDANKELVDKNKEYERILQEIFNKASDINITALELREYILYDVLGGLNEKRIYYKRNR